MNLLLLEHKSLLLPFLCSSKATWAPHATSSRNKMVPPILRQCKQNHTAHVRQACFLGELDVFSFIPLALSHFQASSFAIWFLFQSPMAFTWLVACFVLPLPPYWAQTRACSQLSKPHWSQNEAKELYRFLRSMGNIVVTHLDLLCNADQRIQPSNF